MRGLKLVDSAPSDAQVESHPTWVRGLKLVMMRVVIRLNMSHPTWVRGLKQALLNAVNISIRRTLRGCVD